MLVDQQNLDSLLDGRANVRKLRQEVLKRRVALREAKTSLATALERMEDTLTEIEQQQGRLPFGEAEATEATPPPAGSDGRKPKRSRRPAEARA